MKKKIRGFTLLELLVVLAVIGVFSVVAYPKISNWIDDRNVKKEVFECLNAGVQLIAPECAIPLKTKAENLIAITEGISDWVAETQN